MSSTPRRLLLSGSVFALALATPSTLRAQVRLAEVNVTEKMQRAERLEAEAALIETTDISKFCKAARLQKKAADLRQASDPKGALSLRKAGLNLHFCAKRLDDRAEARDLLAQAGNRALAIGEVFTSARALLDAAYVSAELNDIRTARYYFERAQLLANSAALTEGQRTQLRTAFGESQALMVALRPKQ